MFIAFEGPDGVGKTTQSALFQRWLVDLGIEHVSCRDPGTTPLGTRIREVLLHSDDTLEISPMSEMLLYMAARAQMLEEIIKPALTANLPVVSDRFLLSTVAYQGYAGGLSPRDIMAVGCIVCADAMPNLVFLLDMPCVQAMARVGGSYDRIESRGVGYQEKLRAGYLAEARKMPEVVVVDANRPPEIVQVEIRNLAMPFLDTHCRSCLKLPAAS